MFTATLPPKSTSLYFPALTGIRAIAAYVVFFTHFNPYAEGTWGYQVVREGNSGVTIFFVLSGFLITIRYAHRLAISRVWLGTYVLNRIARIYPLYFLLTTFTFLVVRSRPLYDIIGQWTGYTAREKLTVMILNYTLLKGFFYRFVFTGISQGWTLTVEETFYLLAPLLLLGVVRSSHRYIYLLLYGVALLTIGCVGVRWLPHENGFFNSYNYMFTYTFFGRCAEFLCGMALAFYVKGRVDAPNPTTRGYLTWGGIVWISGCVLLGAYVNPLPPTPSAYSPAGIGLNNFVLPVGIAVFFLGLIQEQTWLRRLLETHLFKLLGQSSYAFYLIHFGVISLLLDRYVTRHHGLHFLFMVGLSILLFRLVEEPLHKKIAKFTSAKQKQVA